MRTLPPKVSGALPIAGHALEFLRDPVSLLERGYRDRGDIYTLRLGRKSVVVLIGNEYAKFYFEQTDKSLSIRDALPYLARMFSPDFYFMADFDEYMRQRQIVVPRFQRRHLEGYLDLMESQAADFIDRLGDKGEIDLVQDLGPLSMRIAACAFLGAGFGEQIGLDFFDHFRKFTGGIDPVTPGWLPLPHLVKSQRSRDWLRAALTSLIRRRRENPVEPADFLQDLVTAQYANGTAVPDHVVLNIVLGLTWAGHETTAGHLAWALIDLLRHPDELEKARAEQRTILPRGGRLDMKLLHQLEHLNRALHETERLHPVVSATMREVTREIELDGFVIPPGSGVLLASAVTHRLPQVFEEPDSYHPDRYVHSPDSMRQLIGFGGGLHRCLGLHFAYLEMKVVVTRLLQTFDLELLDPEPLPISGPRPRHPRSPCRVRYSRR